jgi:hypothetical protein
MAKAMQAGLPVHEQIDVPAGTVYLKMGVHDLLSGRIGTVEIPLRAGSREQQAEVRATP